MKTFQRGQTVIVRTMAEEDEIMFSEEFDTDDDSEIAVEGIWIHACYIEPVHKKHRVLVMIDRKCIDMEVPDNRILTYNYFTGKLANSNTSESCVERFIKELANGY